MKILISWSSGKDSAWMLHVIRSEGLGEPGGLLTTMNQSAGRVAMHAVRAEVLDAQADAVGVPLMTVPLPHPCSNEVYEARMAAAIAKAKAEGFTHVAFGDLFLDDVRRYREERMNGTGLTPIFPLWRRPTEALAREMLDGGLEAYVTCVDPRLLPASFAGRRFDSDLLSELPPGTDWCGERGEFHTCAVGGPMFAKRIAIRRGATVARDGFVFADLTLQTPPAPAEE